MFIYILDSLFGSFRVLIGVSAFSVQIPIFISADVIISSFSIIVGKRVSGTVLLGMSRGNLFTISALIFVAMPSDVIGTVTLKASYSVDSGRARGSDGGR
jgi:carbonic anhydrase/acetyltransferase-like protein (isoleucine patch superfamily)